MKLVKYLFLWCWLGDMLPAGAQQELQVAVFKNLPANAEPETGKYTLFSFRTGKIVDEGLFASDQWDIGFKGTGIIVNGGPERKGKGGAAIVKAVFEAVEKLPADLVFATDEPGNKTAIPGGSGNGWYEYVFTTHEIKPLPQTVLLIRTADGRFAKVEILNYYRDIEGETDAPGRYYTFRYVFQPDGSDRLK